MPSSLIVESLAQLSSYLLGDTMWREGRQALSLLTGVERVQFARPVRAGESLQIASVIAARRPEGAKVDVTASVDGESVATGRLSFAFFEAESPNQLSEFAWTRDLLLLLTERCAEGTPPRPQEKIS